VTITIFQLHLKLFPPPLETWKNIQPLRNTKKVKNRFCAVQEQRKDVGEQKVEIRRWLALTIAVFQRNRRSVSLLE
jgi:hypothetical protein